MGIRVAHTVGPKSVHGVVEVWEHARESVCLVGVAVYLEHDILIHQSLVQDQGLLIVYVVVTSSVYQHVLFTTNPFHPSGHIRVVVAVQIIVRGGQPHEPFRVKGICDRR